MSPAYITHRGAYLQGQRGRGIGSILSALFRGLVPVLKSSAKTVLKEAARKGGRISTKAAAKQVAKKVFKTAKKNAVRAGVNAAINALEGKDVKAGAKRDLAAARSDIGSTLRGSLLDANGNGANGERVKIINKKKKRKGSSVVAQRGIRPLIK